MSRFICFTPKTRYEHGGNCNYSATTLLNEWLSENDVEIISWKPCVLEDPTSRSGKHCVAIVVEYKKRELVDHY